MSAFALSEPMFISGLAKNMAFQRLRDVMINDGVLVEKDGLYEFTKDYLFDSPTTAGSIVIGYAASITEWKTNDGRTLKDLDIII